MKRLQHLLALPLLALSLATAAALPEGAVLIDTRSPAEFESGHIDGAVNIPFDAIEAGIEGLDVNKDSPIYLYCGSGRRAEMARERLQFRGYTAVTNLGGKADAETAIAE